MGLEQVENLARAEGASEAKLIAAREIIVDERVRLKCMVPRCPDYGRNLMCPPALPLVEDFRRILLLYQWALMIQIKGSTSAEGAAPSKEIAYSYAGQLHRLVNSLERKLMGMGFPMAAGLIGGTCRLCEECVGQGSGVQCRHPLQARPSIEAMGINVVATVEAAGLKIAAFPITDEVVWTGLLLLE
ncbi:MAG: DUF2284 domain-containing protein [Bacillota bacterium]